VYTPLHLDGNESPESSLVSDTIDTGPIEM
jgi:hypothetical protein